MYIVYFTYVQHIHGHVYMPIWTIHAHMDMYTCPYMEIIVVPFCNTTSHEYQLALSINFINLSSICLELLTN